MSNILTIKFSKNVGLVEHINPITGARYVNIFTPGLDGEEKALAGLGWMYIDPTTEYSWEPEPAPVPTPTPTSTKYRATLNVNIRVRPSTIATIVGKIIAGSEVPILDDGQEDSPNYHWGRIAGTTDQWVAMWKKDSAGTIVERYLVANP